MSEGSLRVKNQVFERVSGTMARMRMKSTYKLLCLKVARDGIEPRTHGFQSGGQSLNRVENY
jgi:hypothetical protein